MRQLAEWEVAMRLDNEDLELARADAQNQARFQANAPLAIGR
jgi:hypothetical protein